MMDLADGWTRAALAIALLRIDPVGLGGAQVRMRAGPSRDLVTAALHGAFPRLHPIHPSISDQQLFGGIDVAATLASGKTIRSAGVLNGRPIQLSMAERAAPDLAARLSIAMDDGRLPVLIALDEGASEDEAAPQALCDRMAFCIALDARPPKGWMVPMPAEAAAAQNAEADAQAIAELCVMMGIDSLRAPLFALRAARAHAGLSGRAQVAAEDIAAATALVLAHRATQLPETAPEEHEDTAPEPQDSDSAQGDTEQTDLPDGDMIVEAVKALLPPDLLAKIGAGTAPRANGTGAGKKRHSNRRGRPLPPRGGRLDGRSRIDLISTLRAAAPWQPLRRTSRPNAPGLIITGDDIRLKRFSEMSDRVLIFAVDASGSAAVARMGEAKGAIELLLGDAYAKRDHVALIAFRGTGAEPLLMPTRSLVQTKRHLADLPGGGGTPLAAGLRSAFELGQQSTARGMSPTVVVLTDGRANIALDGAADRARAGRDAQNMARLYRGAALPGLVIDTGKRPASALGALAHEMGAPYVPLPRADARSLSAAVSAQLSLP
ncbi:MAG: magnesium chelatase subunit D [Pseudomonadota bacterium]